MEGSEIRDSLVDMVNIPLFTRFYMHPRWLFGISSTINRGRGQKDSHEGAPVLS